MAQKSHKGKYFKKPSTRDTKINTSSKLPSQVDEPIDAEYNIPNNVSDWHPT